MLKEKETVSDEFCWHLSNFESDDERFLYRTGRIGKSDSFNEVFCQRGRIQVNSQEQEVRHLKHIIILGAWSY